LIVGTACDTDTVYPGRSYRRKAADAASSAERALGVLDVSAILGPGKYLLDVQAHYTSTTELVEGGQLLLLSLP
jgi:hypothetical protein